MLGKPCILSLLPDSFNKSLRDLARVGLFIDNKDIYQAYVDFLAILDDKTPIRVPVPVINPIKHEHLCKILYLLQLRPTLLPVTSRLVRFVATLRTRQMCLTGPEAQVSHLAAVLDPLMITPTQQQQVNIRARI